MGGHGILGVPFVALFLGGIDLSLLNERGEGANGFVRKAEFLRQVFVKPNAFLFFGGFGWRISEQVHDKRTVLSANFQLKLF